MTDACSTTMPAAAIDAPAVVPGPPIVPGTIAARTSRLPAGYDETDLRMLEWIAADRRARTAPADLAA